MDNNYNNENNNNSNLFGNESQFSAYNYYTGPSNSGNSGGYGAPSSKKPRKGGAGKVVALILAGALFVSGAGAGGVYVGTKLASGLPENKAETETQVQLATPDTDQKISVTQSNSSTNTTAYVSDVSGIVENVMPAIVAINCTGEYHVRSFWGQDYTQETGGSGSGIIIGQNDEEILIVTNNHVVTMDNQVKDAEIEVVFNDESTAKGTIKGTESGSDLAVVAVKMADINKETLDNIKVATLGDSDSLKVGEMAIAIGNALGYGQSTTVGYISALHRTVSTEDYSMELIQTDAAINPGNSGGALLNVKGEVIGINSAKYSDTSVEGMGFAIPITDAIPIINELMNREEIPESEQAYLGIVGQDVTEGYHNAYGMPIGVYVYQVSQGSPAEAAGLMMGDIITEFNGKKISTMQDLQTELANHRYGEQVTLTVQVLTRGEYKEETLNVTLGKKQ
ncbi:MAG: trypsin-like peptidase domain-containing protein [Lachnospiraceae bacterium]|nr:trypsin-like peptidase domain-containing protein [Lachnospiraceae bacterium]